MRRADGESVARGAAAQDQLRARRLVFRVGKAAAAARARLFAVSGGEKILIKGAVMEPFAELMEGRSAGVLIMAAAVLFLIIQNYLSFYQESRSIYLMRRLPDPWDLFRRTAAKFGPRYDSKP